MAGIYLHIPFCKRKCHYCNFFSVVSLKDRKPFLEALREEIRLQRNYLEGKSIGSVYLGGGTPSLLDTDEIGHLLAELRILHGFEPGVEITLEANPDDIENGKLDSWLNAGINRLSIGVQSFFDDDLRYLNRVHAAQRSVEAVRSAQSAGFRNITIDLIYGIPGMSDEKWEENLEQAIRLDVQHISAYALTVEPRTALDLLIRKQKLPSPSEDETVSQFRVLMRKMKESGFIHYEISNFAREGFLSIHNSNYWSGEHYLGLGPSAHSFNGNSRQWNVGSVTMYINQVRKNEQFYESEILTKDQKLNEYIMTSLRTMWGTDMNRIRSEFGDEFVNHISQIATPYLENNLLCQESGIFYLTDEGKLFADGIASDLFCD